MSEEINTLLTIQSNIHSRMARSVANLKKVWRQLSIKHFISAITRKVIAYIVAVLFIM